MRAAKRYRDNPDKWKEQIRASRNYENHLAICRAWRIANAGKVAAYGRNRDALKRKAPGKHTASDIGDILKAQRNRCAWCKVKLGNGYHVDHIQPVSKLGSNERRNLQVLCRACNLRKQAKDPIDFARENGRLL